MRLQVNNPLWPTYGVSCHVWQNQYSADWTLALFPFSIPPLPRLFGILSLFFLNSNQPLIL